MSPGILDIPGLRYRSQGDLQKEFIAEFEAAHPGVKINMAGKSGDELNAATISSASSGTLPNINTGTTSMGANFVA